MLLLNSKENLRDIHSERNSESSIKSVSYVKIPTNSKVLDDLICKTIMLDRSRWRKMELFKNPQEFY